MPGEVEEVFFEDEPFVRRFGNVLHGYGQTAAGQYLFIVFRRMAPRKGYVITARDMTDRERRYYRRERRR